MDTMPTAKDWCEFALKGGIAEPTHDSKESWDAMAPHYAHKPKRSGYIAQLLQTLDLRDGESVFDMGCGPGILAVPLAKAGHRVFAVDFSDGMLAELNYAVQDAGLENTITAFKRSWQQDWDDLPVADVAISSRSMTTRDFADAVSKLESKARRRVIVTTAAGETPWLDLHVRRALDREDSNTTFASSFVILLNFLLQSGRFPTVSYITHTRTPSSEDADELKAFLHRSAQVTADEENRFERFFSEHVTATPDGRVRMDYEQLIRWAVISWDV